MEVMYHRNARRVGMGRLACFFAFLILVLPPELVTLFYHYGVRYSEPPE